MTHDVMIKVRIVKTKEEKTFVFVSDQSVSEAITEIREACQGKDIGGPSYALFLPPQQGNSHGEWLRDDLSLEVYELRVQKATLEFRNSERTLKVRIPDGSVQTFKVDGRLPVRDVIKSVCGILDVPFPDEYGFITGLGTKTITPKDPKAGEKLVTFESVSNEKSNLFSLGAIDRRSKVKKGSIPPLWDFKKELFMDSDKTLSHQGIEEEQTVTLKKRFYFTDHFTDAHHPTALKFNFLQAVNDVMDGHYLISFDDLVELSVLMLQYCWGDYSEQLFKSIEPAYYLPLEFLLDEKKVKKKIQELWARICLERLSDPAIFLRFMEKTRGLPDFGTSYFHTMERVKKSNDFKAVALGISRKYITLVDGKTRKIKQQYNLEWIKAHAAARKYFTMNFGDHRDEWLTLFTPYGRSIGTTMAGYFRLHMLKKKSDPNAIVFTNEELALANAHYAEEEMVEAELQKAVLSHVNLGNKTELIYTDTGHAQLKGSSSSTLYSPKHPPCVENALAIRLNLPEEKEMERLYQEISLGSTSLEVLTTSLSSADFQDNPGDKDERQWKIETLNVCRQTIRKNVALIPPALIGIFEQYSGIHGELDADQVAQHVLLVSDRLGDFASAIRIASALLDEDSQKTISGLAGDIIEGVRSIFDNLPKPKQPDFYMAAQLVVLDRIGYKVKTLLTEIVANRIEPAKQDDISWLGNNILSGCDSLLFQMVERILGFLKDQPVAAKIVRDDVAKTFLAIKLLEVSATCLAPLVYDPSCKELLLSQVAAASYQIDILENSSKVNLQNQQMKSLLEFNSSSVRELINKLQKALDTLTPLPEALAPIEQEEEPSSSLSEDVPAQLANRTASINYLLSEIAAITVSTSPHYGDPSAPIKFSKQLNTSANVLIQEIRKKKRGIFWDQLIGDITTQAAELSNTLSLYSLSVFNLDDNASAETEQVLAVLGDDLNKLAEVLAEVEGMWEM